MADLLIDDGKIASVGQRVQRPQGVEVLADLAGCWIFPGLVDPHAHLRTPGYEYKEDLATGSMAAAAGGYVTVVGMANTDPAVDSGAIATWILDQAGMQAVVRVGQVGSVSRGLKGEELAEIRELADAGVVAFADDGRPVSDADLLVHALRYVGTTGRPVLLHLENLSLSLDGVMHEGQWSARLGLRGIPSTCESGPLARDLEIVRYISRERERLAAARGGSDAADPGVGKGGADGSAVPLVHFQHLSSADSVRLMRGAKSEGLPVTAEVTPFHLLLTDERLSGFDQNLKVNPPLRSEADRDALVVALADGIIDCIGSDHAPHAPQEKEVPLEDAAFGSTGLETAFAALYSGLVLAEKLSLARLVEAMSGAPSRILGLSPPRLVEGAPADFCVVDLEERWEVTPATLRGKSRNCAFLGETLTGRVRLTVVEGARRFARARGEA
jgi:dihydroorotase